MIIDPPNLTDDETILKIIGEEKAKQLNKDPLFRAAVLQACESWLATRDHERKTPAVYRSARPEPEPAPLKDYWWLRD